MNMDGGWRKVSIGDIGRVITGSTPATASPEFYGGDTPFISPGDLGKSLIVDKAERTLTEAGFARARPVPAGSILYTCIGSTIGKSAIAGCTLATNQQINSVICDPEKADSTFMYYALDLRAESIKRLAGTQAVPIVNKSLFENITFAIPPLSEQRKIGEILRTWDEAIEKLEELKAAKERLAHRLIYILLTGQKRYPGCTGEWKICRLMDVASVSKGKALTKKDVTPGGFPVIAGGKTSPYTHSDYTHEDIVSVSASGAYAGYVSLHREKVWASDCSVIQAKNGYDLLFVYYMLRMNQNRIYSLQIGGAQPHVYSKDLAMMRIQIPKLQEQKKITLILSTMDCEIDTLQKVIDRLKLQKRGLMQKLLTGAWGIAVDGRYE